MDASSYSWLLAVAIALPTVYAVWRLLGPNASPPGCHQPDDPSPQDTLPAAAESPEPDHPDALEQDYEPIGWYQVVEAKKLFRRLEQADVDFHVEAPHMDPCRGDVATAARHGAFGTNAEVLLFVHHQHLEKFERVRQAWERDETDSDGPSLLESIRRFGLNPTLDQAPSAEAPPASGTEDEASPK